MKQLIALVLFFAVACNSCFAGAQPDQKHIDKVRKQVSDYLEQGTRVSVETYDQRKLQGSISEANSDTFVLTVDGRSTTLNYADVKKIKSPMSRSKKQKIVAAIFTIGFLGTVLGLVATQKD